MRVFLYSIYKKTTRALQPVAAFIQTGVDAVLVNTGLHHPSKKIFRLHREEIEKLATTRCPVFTNDDLQVSKLIVTSYFTGKQDPQRGIINAEADFKYIQPWYESMQALQLDGIIFYDALPQSFIEKWQTEKIRFRKFIPGNYSLLEERWIVYYLFLLQSKAEYIFFTDASDVRINKDPFAFVAGSNAIFVGRDVANKVWHSQWLQKEMERYEQDATFQFPRAMRYMPVYNAGILGGKPQTLLPLIEQMIAMTLRTNTAHHKDMSLLNYSIYCVASPQLHASWLEKKITDPQHDQHACNKNIVSGFPLNSRFLAYEENSDAYFTHK